MEFEWDEQKAIENRTKHGVSFEEACGAFDDPYAFHSYDPDHSMDEERYLCFGESAPGRLLVVAYTERGDRTRLVSARRATRSERKQYESDS